MGDRYEVSHYIVPTLYDRAANSFSECAAICAQDPMCGAATYTNRCYIKNRLGNVEISTVGTIVLEVIHDSPSSSTSLSGSSTSMTTSSSTSTARPACPEWNNQEYTTNGVTFLILCNTDNDGMFNPLKCISICAYEITSELLH